MKSFLSAHCFRASAHNCFGSVSLLPSPAAAVVSARINPLCTTCPETKNIQTQLEKGEHSGINSALCCKEPDIYSGYLGFGEDQTRAKRRGNIGLSSGGHNSKRILMFLCVCQCANICNRFPYQLYIMRTCQCCVF